MTTQTVTDDIVARPNGIAGHISLNRPKAIHALTLDMCQAMLESLDGWEADPAIVLILIDHSQGRGFCAGGDVAMLRTSALTDKGQSGRDFFRVEYQLNHRLYTYPRPVVAFMDGITMGGGVGLALPARFRVATENTRFAMPETAIGLFPDVGGGWFLSRLPKRLGRYLALTGARLNGADCLWAGLATHYLPSAALEEAKQRLAAGHEIASVLDALSETPPPSKLAAQADNIAHFFAAETLEGVMTALEADGGEWAQHQLAILRACSPQSCKVALRQLSVSEGLETFAQNMTMEYRLAAHSLMRPDFAEGVRAVLVDKDNAPKWNPAEPEGVTAEILDAIFAPLPADEEWRPQ